MSRQRALIAYALTVSALGWSALLVNPPDLARWPELIAFVLLALLIEGVGFRVPPADPQRLSSQRSMASRCRPSTAPGRSPPPSCSRSTARA